MSSETPRSHVTRRVFAGLTTNVVGQGLSIFIQFLGVPVFLHAWGSRTYGEWLILSAVPAYLSVSDLGFAIVAGNEMTMLTARGDRLAAKELFHAVSTMIFFGSFALIALVVGLVWFLPIRSAMGITELSERSTALILIVLACQVVITLQAGMLDAGFRSVGRYPLGAFCRQCVRVVEVSAVVVAAASGAPPLGAAVAFLVATIVGNTATWFVLRAATSWLDFRLVRVRMTLVRRIMRPALAYTAFPIGTALSLQGMVLVIGATVGPVAVVVFATARQLSRFPQGIMHAINQSVWPEVSAAFGAAEVSLARVIHRRACQGSILISFLVIATLLPGGRWIISQWTNGRVDITFTLMALLLLVIGLQSLWFTSSVIISATNHHQTMALIYLGANALALVLAATLLPKFGLTGAASALLGIDLLMLAYVVPYSLRLVEDTPGGFLRALATPPEFLRSASRRIVGGVN